MRTRCQQSSKMYQDSFDTLVSMFQGDDYMVIIMRVDSDIIIVKKCDVNPRFMWGNQEISHFRKHMRCIFPLGGAGTTCNSKIPDYGVCIRAQSLIEHLWKEDGKNENERVVIRFIFLEPHCGCHINGLKVHVCMIFLQG